MREKRKKTGDEKYVCLILILFCPKLSLILYKMCCLRDGTMKIVNNCSFKCKMEKKAFNVLSSCNTVRLRFEEEEILSWNFFW